jgi:hypothetical protein
MSSSDRPQTRLAVVRAPLPGRRLGRAPPAEVLSDDGNYYLCGRCGTLLVVAEPEQIGDVTIECLICGSINAAA